ncbi:LacI family DNA-binding transcriptional regulator [Salibacterium aidingense]|uniref:LacI family DNA-binding transcriptional regulator n=1 Tax=Salibacterium aidingense TaxID=384933 RepID=UPI000411ADE6|nr:LacI family DNA-binding transcriptional regulator [Salibacterium aidingense]
MNLTIKDIAKMADVSPGTVSKIINNYDNVGEKTRRKVLDVIQETGYQPTFSAKSLATKKSNLIGLIYAGKINVDFTHPFFNEVVSSFKKAVGTMGYDIVMFSNENFKQDNGSYIARCRHFQLDGCLIIAGDDIEEAVYDLVQSDIPCVGVDFELEGPRSSYVITDNKKLSARVVEHLYVNSHRNIAYIGGPPDTAVAKIRERGFRQAMEQFSLSVRNEWMEYGDYFEESGYAAMHQILSASEKPEAVFAASDLMAFGAMKAMRDHGLQAPDDICMIGCDDIEACRYSTPQLTTIRQDKERLGKLAAHMLHDLIHGKQEMPPVFIDPELVIRESCQPK